MTTEAVASTCRPQIVIITSRMGSIADNTSGEFYGYRLSKVAVNMAGYTLAQDLKKEGISVGILHPGFVSVADFYNTSASLTGAVLRLPDDSRCFASFRVLCGLNAKKRGHLCSLGCSIAHCWHITAAVSPAWG